MKIYIETDMTEMPSICCDCKAAQYDGIGTVTYHCLCRPNHDLTGKEYWCEKPAWCPLRTEKEIKEESNGNK